MKSERFAFAIQKIQKLFQIEVCILPQKEEDLKRPGYDPARIVSMLSEEGTGSKSAGIQIAGENVYFGWVTLPDGRWCVCGPMGGERLTRDQEWNFRMSFRIRDEEYVVPKFTYARMMDITELACLLLTGEIVHIQEDEQEGATEKLVGAYDVEQHRLTGETEERARSTYASEKAFVQLIENGDTPQMTQLMFPEDGGDPDHALRMVGVVAKNSDYKQAEYIGVTAIALASRAAIRGNARPDSCYDLSDLYLQKISVATRIEEIYEIVRQALIRFTREVEKEKRLRTENPVVEQCKNYIAKHLFSRFSVQQMARDMALNRTYMSGIFKKVTGVTPQEYILERRIRAAANMLKYSNESIGQIAEYLQLSSPGRFSEYFRRYYSMTPEQYRKENRVIEFMERSEKPHPDAPD